jgi:hypothetical protein
MKAASVLFGCVGLAGNAQKEDEICENTLQRNVVLIISFDSSGIFSATFNALGNHHKTRFLPLLYRAFLVIIILPISVQLFISLRSRFEAS